MSASDVLAVVAATLVAILCGALVVMLLLVARTLRQLRQTVELLREDALALLDETHGIVRDAARDVERVDRLVSGAEKLEGAQRAAYKTLASPVVKAMALGTGVSRAAQKLREPDPPATAVARAKARRKRRTA
jgi:hypothetical protein